MEKYYFLVRIENSYELVAQYLNNILLFFFIILNIHPFTFLIFIYFYPNEWIEYGKFMLPRVEYKNLFATFFFLSESKYVEIKKI